MLLVMEGYEYIIRGRGELSATWFDIRIATGRGGRL